MKQIQDYPNYYITENGEVWSNRKDGKTLRQLKPGDHSKKFPYQGVTLCNDEGKRTFGVHTLVANAFIPNPDSLPLVCHKDDDPRNNIKDNLFWGTYSDNFCDMVRKGRKTQPNPPSRRKLV